MHDTATSAAPGLESLISLILRWRYIRWSGFFSASLSYEAACISRVFAAFKAALFQLPPKKGQARLYVKGQRGKITLNACVCMYIYIRSVEELSIEWIELETARERERASRDGYVKFVSVGETTTAAALSSVENVCVSLS